MAFVCTKLVIRKVGAPLKDTDPQTQKPPTAAKAMEGVFKRMITKPEPAGPRALPPLSDKHRYTHEVASAIARDILEDSGVHTITDGRLLPRGFSKRQRD